MSNPFDPMPEPKCRECGQEQQYLLHIGGEQAFVGMAHPFDPMPEKFSDELLAKVEKKQKMECTPHCRDHGRELLNGRCYECLEKQIASLTAKNEKLKNIATIFGEALLQIQGCPSEKWGTRIDEIVKESLAKTDAIEKGW